MFTRFKLQTPLFTQKVYPHFDVQTVFCRKVKPIIYLGTQKKKEGKNDNKEIPEG